MIPEPNAVWQAAIIAVAILVGLVALAAFLLLIDDVIQRVFNFRGIRIRIPTFRLSRRDDDLLRNVEPIDEEKARQILVAMTQIGDSSPLRIVPNTGQRRQMEIEVR